MRRVLGVALNRYENATVAERTNSWGPGAMCDRPVWTPPESPLEDRTAHETLVENVPPLHKQMGEVPPL